MSLRVVKFCGTLQVKIPHLANRKLTKFLKFRKFLYVGNDMIGKTSRSMNPENS